MTKHITSNHIATILITCMIIGFFITNSLKLAASSLSTYQAEGIITAKNESIDAEREPANLKNNHKVILWLLGVALFDITILIIYLRKKKRDKQLLSKQGVNAGNDQAVYRSENNNPLQKDHNITQNGIYLFGEFRFFNQAGEDYSIKFSPLLKEIFLLILVHSLNNPKGMSKKALCTCIWPDMDMRKAGNNLSVNLVKLRSLLGETYQPMLTGEAGFIAFRMDCVANFYCDYSEAFSFLSNTTFSEDDIWKLIVVLNKGGFLSKLEYAWLDPFKEKISNLIIDWFTVFTENNAGLVSYDLQIQIADTMFNFDMTNEKAMELKCLALTKLGKHSLAKEVYSKFVKEYKTLYDIDFERSFKSITE